MAEENESNDAREKLLSLLKNYTPQVVLKHPTDLVAGQYRIVTDQKITELSSAFATAYAVIDTLHNTQNIYALVYESATVIRTKNIATLKEFRHPNLVAVLEDGVVDISSLGESRYVVILEKPIGQPLANLLSEGKHPVSETILINYFLRPLVDILRKFAGFGISHNRINLNSIYLSKETIMLGECISEPSGYSQDFRFEPIERAMTLPMAKADYAISADCYALAVLALHLSLGFMPFARIDRESFIENIVTKGSYHSLAIEWDFSDNLQDFFRGLLNDTRRERWDPESMENWLAGRHFNMIIPSPPRETARGFDLLGSGYFNRKAIANALFRRFEEARTILFEGKLSRWIETSLHKVELAESVARLMQNARENIKFEAQNNELLTRIIMLLDPSGPIRLKNMAVSLEGIGDMLIVSFLKQNQENANSMVQMIESDLGSFWVEQQKGLYDNSTANWKLQKIRGSLKLRSLGFGIERCIYDIHTELPCHSLMVKGQHITNLKDLLVFLDSTAKQKLGSDSKNDDFMDRHIAGFIASKLELGKEIKLPELDAIPKMAVNPHLIGLKLLIRAQSRLDNMPLQGLCTLVALKLQPLITTIHKKSLRERFQRDLITAASTGMLKSVGDLFFNPDIFVADYQGFQHALGTYRQRKAQILELKNNTILTRHSQIAGRGIAQTLAYGISLTVMYYTLRAYFHF